MAVSEQEFTQTIASVLELLKLDGHYDNHREKELARLLDALAMIYHRLDRFATDYVPSNAPQKDQGFLRENIEKAFPRLGFYHKSTGMSKPDEIPELVRGDAIDDLMDICNELSAAKHVQSEQGISAAAAYFKVSFEIHWGEHLRYLQLYLYNRSRGL